VRFEKAERDLSKWEYRVVEAFAQIKGIVERELGAEDRERERDRGWDRER
jgi:hypothetical protein